jgi:hypothetical protein
MGAVADWTAITGIVVSGVVGPATAAWLALWHQGRSHQHDCEMADVAELRRLLSEASADLREAEGMRGAAASALMTHGEWVRERAPDVLRVVQESGRKVTLQSEQIGLLVGDDHPVAVAHREVVEFIMRALTTLMHADVARGEEARNEWIALQHHDEMKAARARFANEAHRLVGSRVQPT